MKKLLISSPRYPGVIVTVYDASEKLISVDLSNSNLAASQIKHFLSIVPVTCSVADLESAYKGTQAIIVEEGFEYTFEMFWNKYNLKRNRKQAEKIWLRMNGIDKNKAYRSIDEYDRYRKRKPWLEKMYPDTYLRNEHYNDEWNKLN